MTGSILFIFVILICGEGILAQRFFPFRRIKKREEQPDYFSQREQLIKNESDLSLGGKLQLSPIEVRANEVLMTAKNREMHDGSSLSLTIANLFVAAYPCDQPLRIIKSIVQTNNKYRSIRISVDLKDEISHPERFKFNIVRSFCIVFIFFAKRNLAFLRGLLCHGILSLLALIIFHCKNYNFLSDYTLAPFPSDSFIIV